MDVEEEEGKIFVQIFFPLSYLPLNKLEWVNQFGIEIHQNSYWFSSNVRHQSSTFKQLECPKDDKDLR